MITTTDSAITTTNPADPPVPVSQRRIERIMMRKPLNKKSIASVRL